jgi:dTDP-4-dehydrorhamnose reductase
LGSELVRQGCVPIEADVTHFYALKTAVEAAECDVIVHCAAMTDVDACETDPSTAAAINTGGVAHLLQAHPGRIVYLSTDYIFDGGSPAFTQAQPAGPYSETWPPNPISVYGWSKLGGEILIRNARRPGCLIVRTTVLFDGRSGCFVAKVLDKLMRGEYVYVPDELYGSPTYIPHLATDILLAIERYVTGVLNLAGVHVISRYEFARRIAEAASLPLTLVKRGKTLGAAPRPKQAGLTINKATHLGFLSRDPLSVLPQIIAQRHGGET